MRTDRRRFLQAIGAGATVAAARGAFAVEPETSKKPNIILVMADDQGWGDMAYYGHPVLQTPNFDAMAAETLRFDQFYAGRRSPLARRCKPPATRPVTSASGTSAPSAKAAP